MSFQNATDREYHKARQELLTSKAYSPEERQWLLGVLYDIHLFHVVGEMTRRHGKRSDCKYWELAMRLYPRDKLTLNFQPAKFQKSNHGRRKGVHAEQR